MPAIREHDDVAAHLAIEYLAQWDAVPVVAAVAVEHEHRWPRGRKLKRCGDSAPLGLSQKVVILTYLLLVRRQPLIRLHWRLTHVQHGPLQQQERPDLDIVRGRQL